MMKRMIPIIVVFSMLFSYGYADSITFPDLEQSHWSYTSVMTLVADGTIRGFEDGEFKPDNTVSRVEFVKMLGKGTTKKEFDFSDVNTTHWGYDYVMYSGLVGDNQNHFNPDTAITRFDVAQLIWQRAGGAKGIVAPAMVTKQGVNKDAIAWVYAYGLMIGDDGFDLRLNDTLSRAEAATLIVRARAIDSSSTQFDFINHVDEKLLITAFDSAKLFDGVSYDPNRTITNGEMARAAIRLGTEEHNLSYAKYSVQVPFAHEYAKDLYVVGKYCLGEDKINTTFIDQKATVKDTLTALAYNAAKKSHAALGFGDKDNYYKEISSVNNQTENASLTFAYNNGVSLYANGVIHPDKEITLKEFAAFLVQFDGIAGIHSSTIIGDKMVQQNTPLQTNLIQYPKNADQYQAVLKGISDVVYETPFVDIKQEGSKVIGIPKEDFDFAREFGIIITNMLGIYEKNINDANKVKLQFTYYPSLVCNNGNGYTMRLKCEILSATDDVLLKDVFALGDKVDVNQKVYKGMVFFADFQTGQLILDTTLSYSKVALNQIVSISQ